MKNCDEFKGLLVGLLDHELTPEETREVNEHLIRCAGCRTEHERLRQSGGRLNFLSYQEPSDAVAARVWKSPYSRFTRNASLFMIVAGYVVLLGYAAFEFLTSGGEALPAKVGLAAIVLGFLILLLLLVRERVASYRTDPYKEIER